MILKKGHFLLNVWKSLLEEACDMGTSVQCEMRDPIIRIIFIAAISWLNHRDRHLYLHTTKLQHLFQLSLKKYCMVETMECFRQ